MRSAWIKGNRRSPTHLRPRTPSTLTHESCSSRKPLTRDPMSLRQHRIENDVEHAVVAPGLKGHVDDKERDQRQDIPVAEGHEVFVFGVCSSCQKTEAKP